MDPLHSLSLQDVIRCNLCETPVPSFYCDICNINLCKSCGGEHISDESKEHRVVPFARRECTPKCHEHSSKICEIYCQNCNIPICVSCISTDWHKNHNIEDISEALSRKKKIIQEDLQEYEKRISPEYQEAASKIFIQRADARNHSQKLRTALNQQGEALHKEIDDIIQSLHSKIDDMESRHLVAIDKQEDQINRTMPEISQVILELRSLLDTRDVLFVFKYESRNDDLIRLPDQFEVTLSNFTPQEINREQISQQFGFLSEQEIKYPLIEEPQILTNICTRYFDLNCVSCVRNSEFWISGQNKTMMLYNLQGDRRRSVQTKSGEIPYDIATTYSGDLVYTDYHDRTINIVRNDQIQSLVTLQEPWRPYSVCITSSGDLLVTMGMDNKTHKKIVRFSGSKEKLNIPWDEPQKFFLRGNTEIFPVPAIPNTMRLCENKNLDICVSDCLSGVIGVFSAEGTLQFRYTGGKPLINGPFHPVGITTDSHCQILAAESFEHRIHILDKDCRFLRYIECVGLVEPFGLDVDYRDNLIVTEWKGGNVKQIRYYK